MALPLAGASWTGCKVDYAAAFTKLEEGDEL